MSAFDFESTQDAVRALRKAMGLTQEGFARRINMTLRSIERYENRRPPTGNALLKLRDLAFEEGQKDIARFFHHQYLMNFGADMVVGVRDVQQDPEAELIFKALLWGLAEEFAAGSHSFRRMLLEVLAPTIRDMNPDRAAQSSNVAKAPNHGWEKVIRDLEQGKRTTK
jgi:transcriptional regulator with XRE-family HTH domain